MKAAYVRGPVTQHLTVVLDPGMREQLAIVGANAYAE